jgi:hypothetical protein
MGLGVHTVEMTESFSCFHTVPGRKRHAGVPRVHHVNFEGASLTIRSVFSTLQRLAPLQSHNSHLAVLKQMTLRSCAARQVPEKACYSRSGSPNPDRRSRGRGPHKTGMLDGFPPSIFFRGVATGGSQRSN